VRLDSINTSERSDNKLEKGEHDFQLYFLKDLLIFKLIFEMN